MNVSQVSVSGAEGQQLAMPVVHADGRKILARGRTLAADDISLLRSMGVSTIWVTRLDEDELDEGSALAALKSVVAQGALTATLNGGTIQFRAAESCALVAHPNRLGCLNNSGAAVLCTVPQFSYLQPGALAAFLRSYPFAANRRAVEAAAEAVRANGPCFEVIPIRNPSVAFLFTDPAAPGRARELFRATAEQRCRSYGFQAVQRTALEDAAVLRSVLVEMLQRKPDLIIVGSTLAPVTPHDALGEALSSIGAQMTHFLAPVEPGSLLMLAYVGKTAILAVPGCLRSHKPNALDRLMAPRLAGFRVESKHISSLATGGLMLP